jgi:hypothetical protein
MLGVDGHDLHALRGQQALHVAHRGHQPLPLWQSMHAPVISRSVRWLSHAMVRPGAWLVWSRP